VNTALWASLWLALKGAISGVYAVHTVLQSVT